MHRESIALLSYENAFVKMFVFVRSRDGFNQRFFYISIWMI